MSLITDILSAALGQLDDYLAAIEDLDGQQRAALLTRPLPRLREGEEPAPGCWNAYMGFAQWEALVGAFKDASFSERRDLIARARAMKLPEPALPPGYSR